jgi:hypothetical protein
MDDLWLRPYPGWHGVFTRNQAPGAYRNGTRIVKVSVEPSDAHPIGTPGTVLGSIKTDDPRVLATEPSGIAYFVEWDVKRRQAVFVVAGKIRAMTTSS